MPPGLDFETGENAKTTGRRASKSLLSASTSYVYDGANSVQEQSSGAVTANMLSGGVDEYFQRADATGTYFYLTDALGSTVAMSDSSGAVQTTYSYGPYGMLSATGSNTNPYTYTGRESGDGLGLDYYRARYYNPQTGRFISEDPKGFAGSGTNLYAYVGGNPFSYKDPFGLDKNNGRGCGFLCKIFSNPQLLALVVATEIAGGGPENPFADAAVVAEVAEAGEVAGTAAEAAEAAEAVEAATPGQQIAQQVAGQFQNGQCIECSDAIQQALSEAGETGNPITINTGDALGNGNIYSDIAGENVSSNGVHVGVEVDGQVFDPITPNGLPLSQWLDSLNTIFGNSRNFLR